MVALTGWLFPAVSTQYDAIPVRKKRLVKAPAFVRHLGKSGKRDMTATLAGERAPRLGHEPAHASPRAACSSGAFVTSISLSSRPSVLAMIS